MLEFIKFDEKNQTHVNWAYSCQNVIFEDNDGLVRFGYLNANYQGNGFTLYELISGDYTELADWNYFCPIEKKD